MNTTKNTLEEWRKAKLAEHKGNLEQALNIYETRLIILNKKVQMYEHIIPKLPPSSISNFSKRMTELNLAIAIELENINQAYDSYNHHLKMTKVDADAYQVVDKCTCKGDISEHLSEIIKDHPDWTKNRYIDFIVDSTKEVHRYRLVVHNAEKNHTVWEYFGRVDNSDIAPLDLRLTEK